VTSCPFRQIGLFAVGIIWSRLLQWFIHARRHAWHLYASLPLRVFGLLTLDRADETTSLILSKFTHRLPRELYTVPALSASEPTYLILPTISSCNTYYRLLLHYINDSNNNNNHDNSYGAVVMTKVIAREFTRFIWWMQTERRMAANPQTKPVDLGCESAENWLLPSTFTIAIVIITEPVHRRCDSNQGPLTPQSDVLTTRPLWPVRT